MTPQRFRQCLDVIGWSSSVLAAELDVSPRTARRWMSGVELVPDAVATWLERLAAAHEANPPPVAVIKGEQ